MGLGLVAALDAGARVGRGWTCEPHPQTGTEATQDVCTHGDGELAGGVFRGHEIDCPRHGALFGIRTGEVLCAPAHAPIAKFQARIADGAIRARDNRRD